MEYGVFDLLLAEVYRWFIKGFDTADLQKARALLRSWRDLAPDAMRGRLAFPHNPCYSS